jgi:hypothetical protein
MAIQKGPIGGTVEAGEITNGAVTSDKLGTGVVTEAKLADGAVTFAKLAAGAAVPADASITTAKLATQTSIPMTYGSLGSGNASLMKNRLINSDMRIDQRNAGASVTLTSGGIFTVDRFDGVEDTDGAMTAQQDTSAPTGFINSLKFTTTTADGTLGATQWAACRQMIEGTNISDLGWGTASAKTVTLSFWVRSSLTGTFGGALANGAFNRSYPFTYSISVADTWEQKTITIAGDTSGTWLTTNGIGIRVQFGLGVGSTYSGTAGAWAGAGYISATGATSVVGTNGATFYITGVQLEVGSSATGFEYRQYGQELALCQRYFFTTGGDNYYPIIQGYVSGTASIATLITFPVSMRTSPTATKYGTWDVAGCGQPFFDFLGAKGSSMRVTSTGTGMVYSAPNSTDDLTTFSAEL